MEKHGYSKTLIYKCWFNMRRRCLYHKHKQYPMYGGRGITIWEDWIGDFMAFYWYVSKLPHYGEPGRSIDRVDNNGNYEPGNLRWATKKEQLYNRSNSQQYKIKVKSYTYRTCKGKLITLTLK